MLITELKLRDTMQIGIVKISGKSLKEFSANQNGIKLVKDLQKNYNGVILIHGGGKIITEWSQKLGLTPNFIEGQRITSKESMEVTAAVQGGLLNSKLCAYLQANRIKAIGLNGIDMNLFEAEYLNDKLGFVGIPKASSNFDWLIEMLKDKVVPVFSSICRDKKGNLMNVNADLFAGEITKLLRAKSIYFFSDIEGVKLNGKFQNQLTIFDLEKGLTSGQITDGMIPKINTCINLLNNGINKVWIGNKLKVKNNNLNGTWIQK